MRRPSAFAALFSMSLASLIPATPIGGRATGRACGYSDARPHPSTCERFLVCSPPNELEMDCFSPGTPTLYFSYESQACLWPEEVTCQFGNDTSTTPTTTTSEAMTTTTATSTTITTTATTTTTRSTPTTTRSTTTTTTTTTTTSTTPTLPNTCQEMNDRCSYDGQLIANSEDDDSDQSYFTCISDGLGGFHGCPMSCPADTVFYESMQRCWFRCSRSEAHTDAFCATLEPLCTDDGVCTSDLYDVKGECDQYRYCFRNASIPTLKSYHVCQQSCPSGHVFRRRTGTCEPPSDDPRDACITCVSGDALHKECAALRPRPSCLEHLPCQSKKMDHPDPADCHRFEYCYTDAEQDWRWSRCTEDCGVDDRGHRLGFDRVGGTCARPNSDALCTFVSVRPIPDTLDEP